jgi:hypothetical protein
MTATVEAPKVSLDPGEVAQTVEQVPDQLRAEIVAAREAGTTLAELKTKFGPQVAVDVIRELLPPMNACERKQREKKEGKVTETTQGVGGRSGKQESEPKAPKVDQPKPAPAPRYIEDHPLVMDLSERTLAARQVMGRNTLAEALEATGPPCGASSRVASTRPRSTASRRASPRSRPASPQASSSRRRSRPRSPGRRRPNSPTASRRPSSTCAVRPTARASRSPKPSFASSTRSSPAQPDDPASGRGLRC